MFFKISSPSRDLQKCSVVHRAYYSHFLRSKLNSKTFTSVQGQMGYEKKQDFYPTCNRVFPLPHPDGSRNEVVIDFFILK